MPGTMHWKTFSKTSALCLFVFASMSRQEAWAQETETVSAPSKAAVEDDLNEVTRQALRAAPRLKKLGRIRGARIVSDVRFTSAPDVPYELTASFAFPDRARIILASAGGAYERYRLGSTFFGRDVIRGQEKSTQSGLLRGPGRTETHLDMALRRAVFFWPDAPEFTGKGTTYSAKVADLGILLATVDEATGLPTRLRTFGPDGQAGAEMHSIEWGPAPDDPRARRWPTSMVFAAGGSDVWTETVSRAEPDWRFTDAWFLPMDRLTAVMGTKAAGKLRILPRPSAWVLRRELASASEPSKTLTDLADQLCAGWAAAAAEASAAFPDGMSAFVSPFLEIELDEQDRPIAVRYEVTAARGTTPKGDGWQWRAPENAWSHPLEASELRVEPGSPSTKALSDARDAIATARQIQADENAQTEQVEGEETPVKDAAQASEGPKAQWKAQWNVPRLIRFQVGEESLGSKTKSRAVSYALVVEAVEAANAPPK